jgi:hypothetical protein
MCPACLAAAAVLAAKVASGGGLAAYGVFKLRSKSKPKPIDPTPETIGECP